MYSWPFVLLSLCTPPIGLFAEPGWNTVSPFVSRSNVPVAPKVSSVAEMVLVFRLRAALERLKPGGQVELAEGEQFHPNGAFHHPVKRVKGLKTAIARFH